MIGKMIIKLTLNEATDPDLYAYLAKFDNARIRAGVLKAAAGASVRGDRMHAVPTPHPPAAFASPVGVGLISGLETGEAVEPQRQTLPSFRLLPSTPSQQEASSREKTISPSADPSVRQWNSDAIGEEFARDW